jgi:hypothetical protein
MNSPSADQPIVSGKESGAESSRSSRRGQDSTHGAVAFGYRFQSTAT